VADRRRRRRAGRGGRAGRAGADLTDTDADLVTAAKAGDRGALDALLRRHHDRIAAVCRRVCGNDADGADATQEALIAVVRGLDRYDGRAAFSTWAYRVATNASLDELRRRSRRPVSGLDESVPRAAPGDVGEAAAARVDADEALTHLAPEFRAAVVLRDLCGLDYAEIAEVLEVPAGTVRSRIARGRAQLADRLAGNPDGPARRPTTQP
jgi:RNA polymerase sigma-70 factor (ECF subfamily)